MTSKERLMAVLKHEMPDRVPISAYEMVAWNLDAEKRPFTDNMQKYIHDNITFPYMTGWQNHQYSYRPIMDYIRENTDCIFMIDVDTINTYTEEHTYIEQWTENESTHTKTTIVTPKGDLTKHFVVNKDVKAAWQTEPLIKTDEDIERYLSIPSHDLKPVNIEHIKKANESLGDNGILMIDIEDPLCIAYSLFDFGEYTVKAYTDPKIFTKILDKAFEQQMYFLEDMLKKGAGPLFRIVGCEVAAPPYLYPEHFHEYVCKYDKQMIRLIHDYGQYVRIHCHGRIKEVLPHFIEMEADAIDPVEAPPSGDIELAEVKRLYGDKLCLMGNLQLRDIDTLEPEEMKAIVKKCMEEGKKGGGFVIMPTATPIDIPLASTTERNLKIFIDTALEYGAY